jgi:hypothetical protein
MLNKAKLKGKWQRVPGRAKFRKPLDSLRAGARCQLHLPAKAQIIQAKGEKQKSGVRSQNTEEKQ